MAEEGFGGKAVVGHVFWVRDEKGAWHHIMALRGIQGERGERGDVLVPSVSADGTVSWRVERCVDDGALPLPVNIKGPQGERGPRGQQGDIGPEGPQGEKGKDGESAYETAVAAGYSGTFKDFMDALSQVVETQEKAEEALDLAKRNNHAHVFETREDHDAWMADPQMKVFLNVGDMIYIKATKEAFFWDGETEVPSITSDNVMEIIKRELASIYRPKGSVQTFNDLPKNPDIGDVYNVIEDGQNWAWVDGDESNPEPHWDALGPTIDLSGYATQTWADGRYPKRTGTNVLDSALKFINKRADGQNDPIFRFGSQFTSGLNTGDAMREDRYMSEFLFNGIRFIAAPGSQPRFLLFNGGADDSVVRKAEMDEGIEGLKAALDAKADVEGGVLFDPQLLYRAQAISAPYDSNAVVYGHYGPFSMLGCEGAYVVPKTIGIRRRSGATFPGGDTPLYLRVLRAVNGAWVVAYQSDNAVRLMDTAAEGAPIGPWEMRPVGAVSPIPSTEPVAIVATASKDAAPYDCVQFGAKSSAYAKGGLSGPIGQNPATHPIVAFTISFNIGYSVIRDFADYLLLTGGTVNGPLRMTLPAVADDPDDPSKDIAFVPTANGEHLQVQFPSGKTMLVRGNVGGSLATVGELNAVGNQIVDQVNTALGGYLPLSGGTVNGHLVAFNQSVSDTLLVRGVDIRATLEKKQNKLIAGDNVTLTEQADGTVKVAATGGAYTLPAATASTLGGVKVGSGLTVTSDGTLSAEGGGDSPEGTAHWGSSSYGASFGYIGGSGISISGRYSTNGIDGTFQLAFNGTNPETGTADVVALDVPTKGYVDEAVASAGGGSSYTLPAATRTVLGGVKAPTPDEDSVVSIGADGRIHTYGALKNDGYTESGGLVLQSVGSNGAFNYIRFKKSGGNALTFSVTESAVTQVMVDLATKAYVDNIVGDIQSALAAI